MAETGGDAAQPAGGTPQPPAPVAPAAAPAPQRQPVGRVHRLGGINIKPSEAVPTADVAQLVKGEEQQELPPLELEMLKPWWAEALHKLKAEQPKLAESLGSRELKVDGKDHFVILVPNAYNEAEIKPYLVGLLETLRRLSGRRMLNCSIEIVYEEKAAVIYSPRDKYDALSAKNPALNTFKVLFPEVDY